MNRIKIPFSELRYNFARSSGAGGQHINKANTKVILTWNIDESVCCTEEVKNRFKKKFHQYVLGNGLVQISSQKTRSQKANIDNCIQRLHDMINEVRLPPKTRKLTRPKKSAILKRLESKKKEAQKKLLRKKDF